MAGLKGHFHFAEKKGYSGVAMYTKHAPSDVIVGWALPSSMPKAATWNCASTRPRASCPSSAATFPAARRGKSAKQAKFRFLDEFDPYLARLKTEREFILCGDINIAHKEQDLKNWRGNRKNSGFLPEERAWMTKLLSETGLVDVYRTLQPERDRDRLHVVEQPRPGLPEERRLAPGLSLGHTGARAACAQGGHLQGRALLGPCAHYG
jgi:exodeoxyribonuclease-3